MLDEDRNYAVLVFRGHHRIAALAALGYVEAPIRIKMKSAMGIVRRSEVDAWPHVRRGYFTREQALAVFDRLLSGQQPEALLRALSRSQHRIE